MTSPNGTEHRAIVDTHRHPIGPKLAAKIAKRGFYDPKQEFPQTNAQDLIGYREFYDLGYAMPKQREGGVTLSLARNGGEVEWFARDYFKQHRRRPQVPERRIPGDQGSLSRRVR
jgi:hypothetical protein